MTGVPVALFPMTSETSPQPADKAIKERIREFNRSEFARLLGMEILEAHEGYSRVTMDCAGKMNPSGVAHGGAIFALADQAFGIAANCCGIHRVAVSVSILYIAPAKGILVAIAKRVDDNGSCDTYRVMIHEGDRPVAEFTGVAFRV
jgi:acyl-CoA thioesterase